MKTTIEQLAEHHFEQLHRVADQVARERRYLAMLEAPPVEHCYSFYREILASGQCHVVVHDGTVVGWCDVTPVFGESRRHVGTLGIGLLPAFRGSGVGFELMKSAIEVAWARGLSRIELTVREDNLSAKALYERLGFAHEGVKRDSMLVDDRYYDCYAMALLRDR